MIIKLSEKKVDWKHGCIKEVAAVLHEKYNLTNITYEIGKNNVIFLSDNLFVGAYYYPKYPK